jgi:hypothetical protein
VIILGWCLTGLIPGNDANRLRYEQYLSDASPEDLSRDLLLLDKVIIQNANKGRWCPDWIVTLPKQPEPHKPFRRVECATMWSVYDNSTQYFDSGVNGTAWCGARPGRFSEDQNPAIAPHTLTRRTTTLLNTSSPK